MAPAGDAEVLMHFGMTGRLDWERRGTDRHVHDRIVFVCRGGELRYRNMRKFGGVWISRRARVDPRTPVGRLSRRRIERLWRAMDEVVRESLPTGRVPPAEGWLTGVRDQRDARCPRCGARLRRATVAGRTTVWCGRCQRR